MSLNARTIKGNGSTKKHPPLEAGTYPARLVQVLDLGLQAQRPYKGQEKNPANEIMLTYEFVDEFLLDEEGNEDRKKPRWQSETIPLFSLNADKAKSTQRYYALDPKEEAGGDFTKLLGTPVMVTIIHNDNPKDPTNPYVNIASTSTMRPKEAAKIPELVNSPKSLDLDNPDVIVFLSLPEWVQTKIKGNLNYEGSALDKALKEFKSGDVKKPVEEKREEIKEEVMEEEQTDTEEDW